ncbi:MAG: type II secretion system F family protein [Candidatus Liptonbacteria bacterium]|nr:type II secretion system F family protein [Candidatus Liptonbacteria bacterium]
MNKLKRFLISTFGIGGVPIQEKINFARHLSIVIKAGLPILEGLRLIKRQTASRAVVSVIDQVIVDVGNGQFLATSLSRYPHIFDDFFISIVRVGETSGTLAQNLVYLADELKKSHDLRNKVRSAMIYPVIIMIVTSGLVSFLVFFAFPKILPLFASLRVELPVTTRVLIATTAFFLAHGVSVVAGLVAFFVALRILLILRPTKMISDRLLIATPIFSKIIIDVNMANFTRVLSVLLKGGIKIVEAVTITSQTFNNLVYRRELARAAEGIQKGDQLAKYLAHDKNIFPMLLSGLIEIGENTGNLEDNLTYLSDYYREEAEQSINTLTALIEPLLLLLMGMVVGFVAISIISPIYQITQGVR